MRFNRLIKKIFFGMILCFSFVNHSFADVYEQCIQECEEVKDKCFAAHPHDQSYQERYCDAGFFQCGLNCG